VNDPYQREQLISRLRVAHGILAKVGKGGFIEDEHYTAFRTTIFKELPLLKDIPNNFRLKVKSM
jgi:hypothetical protein